MAHSSGDRNQRQLRVGELIRRVLVEIFDRVELRDPDIAGVSITISEVSVSPDLKAATVYAMPLGGHGRDTVMAGLARAAPFLRSRIARELALRRVPSLEFRLDTAFDASERISELLPSVRIAVGNRENGDGT